MACAHIEQLPTDTDTLGVAPDATGCTDCLATGGHWVHLRRCLECGHVGCCDSSPNRHATAHSGATSHALIQSFEPGEEWLYCFADDEMAQFDGMAPSPSHP